MTRCVEDIALWMKVMCDERYHLEQDPYHKLVEFKVDTFKNHSKKKLKIGFIKSYPAL
jgi:Asp-tRNA(Asn)/Glu-tRNA(Gln) amidotransferase A subunit family amidase